MFTTVAVMQLVDQGLVSLEAPVVTYIPDFKMEDPRYRDIAVRMLLNHSFGLQGQQIRGGMTLGAPYPEYAEHAAVAWPIARHELAGRRDDNCTRMMWKGANHA